MFNIYQLKFLFPFGCDLLPGKHQEHLCDCINNRELTLLSVFKSLLFSEGVMESSMLRSRSFL